MSTRASFFTSHDIAKLISVSPSTVLNWIDAGLLQCHRTPGGHRRVSRDVLIRFLRENEMPVPRELTGVARLLVVDDDHGVLRSVKRLVERRSRALKVETSDSAMDALLRIGISCPDAVLIDAYMPGMNGVELCRQLSSNSETQHISIVALSGKMTRKLERDLFEAGAAAVLKKPLDSHLLFAALKLERPAAPVSAAHA